MTIDKSQIRNASTVIVLRDRHSSPRILMGQRGSKAVFMPNKFVFPGGAVDAGDAGISLASPLPQVCADRLTEDASVDLAHAISVAAIRELWEETGLILGKPGGWHSDPPEDWETFAATGHVPDADVSPSGQDPVYAHQSQKSCHCARCPVGRCVAPTARCPATPRSRPCRQISRHRCGALPS